MADPPTPPLVSGHPVTPVRGSARQLDGTPADLLRPLDYPVEALCLECGGLVRCERWFQGEWVHIAAFTMAPPDPLR